MNDFINNYCNYGLSLLWMFSSIMVYHYHGCLVVLWMFSRKINISKVQNICERTGTI